MPDSKRLKVRGIELEVVRQGAGRPMLLLHGFQTIDPDARVLELLSRHGEIVAPSGPGFGRSPRPQDFDTVYDLVHLYLELLDTLPSHKVTLVGFSFGGWLAESRVRADKAQRADLGRYMKWMRARGLSARSAARALSSLRSFYGFAGVHLGFRVDPTADLAGAAGTTRTGSLRTSMRCPTRR